MARFNPYNFDVNEVLSVERLLRLLFTQHCYLSDEIYKAICLNVKVRRKSGDKASICIQSQTSLFRQEQKQDHQKRIMVTGILPVSLLCGLEIAKRFFGSSVGDQSILLHGMMHEQEAKKLKKGVVTGTKEVVDLMKKLTEQWKYVHSVSSSTIKNRWVIIVKRPSNESEYLTLSQSQYRGISMGCDDLIAFLMALYSQINTRFIYQRGAHNSCLSRVNVGNGDLVVHVSDDIGAPRLQKYGERLTTHIAMLM